MTDADRISDGYRVFFFTGFFVVVVVVVVVGGRGNPIGGLEGGGGITGFFLPSFIEFIESLGRIGF